ncbi:hypothetical protein ILUMI_19467 [Ignelater luminosus]|uniref:CCHC-type domain-containing protein n=1 Tax=Ignelater luminosus TaxID=2038154 RepID=A0A8K0G378_IGNLU|nr:hypothetical protein ILUMI_19467 [Ignelater luminosus]
MSCNKKNDVLLQMFEGTNYDKWKFRLNLFLEMKECNEVILYEQKPSTITEDAWKKKEIKAKNYIVNTITNTQLELIISETSARKMIENLDEIYLIKNSAMKLLRKRKLLDLKMQENENPTDFFNKSEKQLNELKNSGETVSGIDKLNYLLLALPETLSHIVDIVDALPQKDRSVEYTVSIMILKTFSTNVSKNIKNFNTQNFNYKQQQSKNYNSRNYHYDQPSTSRYQDKPNNTVQRCFKCNRPGHTQRYCRSNPNWRGGYSRNLSRNNLTRVAGNSILEDGAKAESTSNSFNVEVMSAETNTKQEARTVEENDIKWLLDSGCSDHIVNTDR